MIGTITPLVQEAHGTTRWIKAVVGYSVGSVAAAVLVGSLVGEGGQLLGAPWKWGFPMLAVAALGTSLVEFGLVTGPRQRIHRSTRKSWKYRYGETGSATLWGADLGLGVTTRVSFASFWILLTAALLLGEPGAGAMLMSGYGLGRATLVATGPLLTYGRPADAPGDGLFHDTHAWHRFHGLMLVALTVLVLLCEADLA